MTPVILTLLTTLIISPLHPGHRQEAPPWPLMERADYSDSAPDEHNILNRQMELIRQGKLHVDQPYGQIQAEHFIIPQQTALIRAIQAQNMQHIAELIDRHHADVNKTSYNTPSPLQEAYETGNLTLIRHLIARGATSTWHDQTEGRTFRYACRSGNPETIRHYLSRNIPPTTEQLSRNLHYICASGDIELVRMALSRGANPNMELFEEAPPLCAACHTGNLELVRLLLDHGADITGHGSEETSCIDNAIMSGNQTLVEHLETIEQQKKLDLDPQKIRLLIALYFGHNHLIDYYIAKKYPVNTPSRSAKNTLLIAAQNGCISLITYLLDQQTDIHSRDEKGNTPLHLACRHNHPAAARALLVRGANAALRNLNGQTSFDIVVSSLRWTACSPPFRLPATDISTHAAKNTPSHSPENAPENTHTLHQACQNGDETTVARLLRSGTDPNARDNEGNTPLHTSHPDSETIPELLILHGASVNARNAQQQTPLQHACETYAPRKIAALLHHGANPNQTDTEGNTPLMQTCKSDYKLEMSDILIRHGAATDIANRAGETPLSIAMEHGNLPAFAHLLRQGADPDFTPAPDTPTLLQNNCHDEKLPYLHLLLQHGADVSATTPEGRTALHHAASISANRVALLLLTCGADPNALDNDGSPPLSYNPDSPGTIHILLSYGANPYLPTNDSTIAEHMAAKPLLRPMLDNLPAISPYKPAGNIAATIHRLRHQAKTILIRLTDRKQPRIHPLARIPGYRPTPEDTLPLWMIPPRIYTLPQNNNAGPFRYPPECIEETILTETSIDAPIRPHDSTSETPLTWACRLGDLPLAAFLIDTLHASIDRPDATGTTPLEAACSSGNTLLVKHLIHEGANRHGEISRSRNILAAACTSGNMETISYLLAQGAQWHPAPDSREKNTLLHRAARAGSPELVRLLLARGEPVHAVNIHRETPLFAACASGSIPTAELLLQHGADINHPSEHHDTPLSIACQWGNLPLVKHLIAHRADIRTRNASGDTLLHQACCQGQTDIALHLIRQGLQLAEPNAQQQTPFDLAVLHGQTELVRELLRQIGKRQARTLVNSRHNLLRHIGNARKTSAYNPAITHMLLDHGAIADTSTPDGIETLIHACRTGDTEFVRKLLATGSRPDIHSPSGETPLMAACRNANLDLVHTLLRHGADPASKNNDGTNALFLACSPHQTAIFALLEQAGTDLHATTRTGTTLLTPACAAGNLPLVRHLASKGLPLQATMEKEQLLAIACASGNPALVHYLLHLGANINARGPHGRTPLFHACDNARPAVIRCLAAHGANFNARDNDGQTPTFSAMHEQAATVIPLLRKYGIDLNAPDNQGNRPLTEACREQNIRLIRALLTQGADPNLADKTGHTPLSLSARSYRPDIATLLLKHKATAFPERTIALILEQHRENHPKLDWLLDKNHAAE